MTKEERREYAKKYYQANREKIKEYKKQYYQNNAERFKEYQKQYNQDNSERIKEQKKQYYQDNAERHKEQMKQYRQTPMGRASILLSTYNQSDKKHNRGKGDLTAEWIVENIFTQPCHYCGKEGWEVIGCDRIDNSKPHTEDNVIPCCMNCNRKRGTKEFEDFRKKTNEPSY